MLKRDGGETLADVKTSLCFEKVTVDGGTPNCKDPSDFVLGRKINWSQDGKTLLVFGASRDATKFGMVGYESKKPFSTDPADWESKGFVTDTSKPGQGVLDAAFSPDGKQLAVVSLGKSGRPELSLTTADDLLLANAKALKVIACKVIWRPDGQDLVIVRSDDCFSSETGNLIRLSPRDPKDQTSLNLSGDNPVFQPITPG
jgi:dipeptidyl aminopeptidase/acylaminoacyl peptidase